MRGQCRDGRAQAARHQAHRHAAQARENLARHPGSEKGLTMFPAQFEYHRAASVKDALALLKQFGDDAKLLSGGHSLLPMMKLRLAQPTHLIDIARVADLRTISEQGGKIVIGAAATHDQIASSDLIRNKAGLLSECASAIGDVQVRNRGTI